jgi:hypothetical protein
MASTAESKWTGRQRRGKVHPGIQASPGLTRNKYLFGEDEELANREICGDNSALHPPPRFQQIVADDTGKDYNAPSGPTHRGDIKFSGGIGPTN